MPIRPELRAFYRGPAWEATRAAIRERAGDRCEQCGLANGTVALHLRDGMPWCVVIQCGCAHLNNKAGDDRPENLAWLCRGCHLHLDKPFHRLTRAIRKDRKRPVIVKATEPYQVTIEDAIEFGRNFEALGRTES